MTHERLRRRATSYITRPIPWPEALKDPPAASVPGLVARAVGQPAVNLVVARLADTGTGKIEVTADEARRLLARPTAPDEPSEAA